MIVEYIASEDVYYAMLDMGGVIIEAWEVSKEDAINAVAFYILGW